MKITETRKAIIELIGDYMDKTLSEGCLVKTDIKNYKITKVIFHGYQSTDYTGRQFEYILCINGNKTKRISKWKILGHYDMTAVLKYLDNLGLEYTIEICNHRIYFAKEWCHKTSQPINFIDFPNKPLHLYTDEEDKQLLDLLLKIK